MEFPPQCLIHNYQQVGFEAAVIELQTGLPGVIAHIQHLCRFKSFTKTVARLQQLSEQQLRKVHSSKPRTFFFISLLYYLFIQTGHQVQAAFMAIPNGTLSSRHDSLVCLWFFGEVLLTHSRRKTTGSHSFQLVTGLTCSLVCVCMRACVCVSYGSRWDCLRRGRGILMMLRGHMFCEQRRIRACVVCEKPLIWVDAATAAPRHQGLIVFISSWSSGVFHLTGESGAWNKTTDVLLLVWNY